MRDTLAIIFTMLAILVASARGQTTQPSLSRVYAHEAFPLGNDPALRNIHPIYSPGIPGFWKRYIDTNAERYAAIGVRGIILHNPMGTARGNRYVIDGYQNAPKWLRDDFVAEWKAFHRQHPNIEVIAYVGCEPYDSTPLTVERARASLKPFVDAGMSIGIDASALFDRFDLRRQVMRELWADGVPVYSESYATSDRPWMGEFHQAVTPEIWRDVQARPHLYVPRDQIGGHVIVWTAPIFTSPQRHAQLYKDLIGQGVFAAGPVRYFWDVNADPRMIEQ